MKEVPEELFFLGQGLEGPFVYVAYESGTIANLAARPGPFPTSKNVYPVR